MGDLNGKLDAAVSNMRKQVRVEINKARMGEMGAGDRKTIELLRELDRILQEVQERDW